MINLKEEIITCLQDWRNTNNKEQNLQGWLYAHFLKYRSEGYVIEMEIYRLGSFRGTAVETQGMLVYIDDFVDLQGTIQYDLDHAVFVVTESSSDLVEVGTTWVFPEMLEG